MVDFLWSNVGLWVGRCRFRDLIFSSSGDGVWAGGVGVIWAGRGWYCLGRRGLVLLSGRLEGYDSARSILFVFPSEMADVNAGSAGCGHGGGGSARGVGDIGGFPIFPNSDIPRPSPLVSSYPIIV